MNFKLLPTLNFLPQFFYFIYNTSFFYFFFKKLLSTTFDSIQTDIEAIFIFDSESQIDYKHVYYVRNSNVTDDQNINNRCDPNPCKNNGSCSIGYNNIISCICPENYKGDFLLKTIIVKIIVSSINKGLFVKLNLLILDALIAIP